MMKFESQFLHRLAIVSSLVITYIRPRLERTKLTFTITMEFLNDVKSKNFSFSIFITFLLMIAK